MTTTIGTTMTTMTMTGTTEPAPMRHELKHQISPPEDLVLSGRLRRLFPHDKHAGAGCAACSPTTATRERTAPTG